MWRRRWVLLFLLLTALAAATTAKPPPPPPPLLLTGSGTQGLRPSPSHDLPIMDLIEPPDKMYDPKPSDLDPKALKERLGKQFDSRFMSAKKPAALASSFPAALNDSLGLNYKRNKNGRIVPVGKMPKDIKKLRFKFVRLPDGHKLRSRVTPKLRRKLRQFLWAYTYCPVVSSWKDLGLRFWPRWIREGHCFTGGHSCSFPEGMSCKPNQSITKTLLRWHCGDWNQSKYCKWIPVRYPIITGCSCSC